MVCINSEFYLTILLPFQQIFQQTGDQILKVNNVELDGRTLEEALMIIKEQSTDITLTILPSEQATAHLGEILITVSRVNCITCYLCHVLTVSRVNCITCYLCHVLPVPRVTCATC